MTSAADSPYGRQGETILTWTDVDNDYALSFQELPSVLAIFRCEIVIKHGGSSETVIKLTSFSARAVRFCKLKAVQSLKL